MSPPLHWRDDVFSRWLLGAALLACAGHVAARLDVLTEQELPARVSYGTLVLDQKPPLWLLARAEGGGSLQLQPFATAGLGGSQRVEPVPALMLLAPINAGSADAAVLGAFGPDGRWSLLQVSTQTPRVLKQVALEGIESISQIASAGKGFVVAGMSQKQRAVLVVLDATLRIIRTIELPTDVSASVTGLAILPTGAVYAVSSPMQGPPQAVLWKLSAEFRVLAKRTVNGSAASIVSFGDGLALSYSLGDSVYVEKASLALETVWRTQTHRRAGASTLNHVLVPVGSGLALVGGNKGRLMVARVSSSGELERVVEDERTGLLPPSEGYSAQAVGDAVHVRGVARRRDSPVNVSGVLFHFVETR